MSKLCLYCKKVLDKSYINVRKFCSVTCRTMYGNDKRKDGLMNEGYNLNLSTGTRGAISEIIVCADLLIKEFEVFRAISPSCSCDMIALKNNKFFRVEVRTTTLSPKGKPYKVSKKGNYDILAVVHSNNKIIYKGGVYYK